MKEFIISCEMIENEVRVAYEKSGNSSEIIWLERGLHEDPEKLRQAIQQTIDSIDADLILLAFGLCGNALEGIVSNRAKLVVPRFHDCIHMLLATEANPHPSTATGCLYYTDGWFNSDMIMLRQYELFKEKRGEEKAKRIFRKIFKNYHQICLINTGLPWRDIAIDQAHETAALFELDLTNELGSTSILERLFAHDWDGDFVLLNPGTPLSAGEFLYGTPCVLANP